MVLFFEGRFNFVGLYQNTQHCAERLLEEEGILGFTRGLSVALQRNGIWNGPYFGCISIIKGFLPHSQSQQLFYNFIAGFIGGTFATVFNTPFGMLIL